jgi:transposase
VLDRLLPHKAALETHLKKRMGQLFDLDYDLLLYDVTSSYFEGLAKGNPLAQYGYSRDRRGDCKQVCIALVVTKGGFPLGYEVFAGNRADVTTVEEIVQTMESRYSRAAGLFKTDVIQDADGRVRLFWSPTRQSYGDGAEKVEAWRDWAALSEGCYILRTNITDWSGEDLWKAYMQLTDAEAAFRIHKSDLRIRPIWHQRQDRVKAHILVCFLAYVLWRTLGQMCQQKGLGDEPRRVIDELSQIRMVDVVLPTRSGVEIRRRCITQPTEHQAILLQHLGLHLPSHLPIAEQKMSQL